MILLEEKRKRNEKNKWKKYAKANVGWQRNVKIPNSEKYIVSSLIGTMDFTNSVTVHIQEWLGK